MEAEIRFAFLRAAHSFPYEDIAAEFVEHCMEPWTQSILQRVIREEFERKNSNMMSWDISRIRNFFEGVTRQGLDAIFILQEVGNLTSERATEAMIGSIENNPDWNPT